MFTTMCPKEQQASDSLIVKGDLEHFHKLSLFDRFRHVENSCDINF